jgi:hypothetical protein
MLDNLLKHEGVSSHGGRIPQARVNRFCDAVAQKRTDPM